MDDWRVLLYPLGFIPNIAFGLRFLIQWLQSERQGKSIVTPLFWYLSITGNLLFMVHAFIQIQFPICLIQAINALLSWRNLSLSHGKSSISTRDIIILMIAIGCTVIGAFALHDYLSGYKEAWIRVPVAPWQIYNTSQVSFGWHFFGTIGYILFSTRFWIQWWLSEKAHKSYLPESFWWASLLGSLLILAYAIRIGDSVNYIGPMIGLIPYARNLALIRKSRQSSVNT